MNLVLTDAAAQLLENTRPEKKVIRLDAKVRGGCGISVELTVLFDDPRQNDRIIHCNKGIDIYMDRFTERYLPEQTKIDYSNSTFTVTDEGDSKKCL